MSLDIYLICVHCKSTVYESNITHNLAEMAANAGIYKCLWRAPENGFKTAKEIKPLLQKAITDMNKRPDFYKQFNPLNGWGSYSFFLPWLNNLLDACEKYPDSNIETSV